VLFGACNCNADGHSLLSSDRFLFPEKDLNNMMNNDEVFDDCSIGGERKESLDAARGEFLERYRIFMHVRQEMRRHTVLPGRTFQGVKMQPEII